MASSSHLGRLAMVAVLAGVCGSGTARSAGAVEVAGGSATVHLGAGRQAVAFSMHEPAGIIRLYRVSAPRGSNLRVLALLPGVTVPLELATKWGNSCTEHRARITCT